MAEQEPQAAKPERAPKGVASRVPIWDLVLTAPLMDQGKSGAQLSYRRRLIVPLENESPCIASRGL